MERACAFGPNQNLIGVLAEPEPAAPAGRPAVILVNGGFLHRVGPFRLYVDLSRRLAQAGFLALRFDPTGFGDSDGASDGRSFDEHVQHDVVVAMDHLAATKGCREFVLFGLCSGADNAYHIALRDKRVVGMVWIDGFAYRTPGYYVRWYLPRILSAQKWRSLFHRLAGGAGTRRVREERGDLREFPAKEKLREDLVALVGAGCRMLLIYTGGYNKLYNHQGQLQAAIGRIAGGAVVEEFYRAFDHIFTLMEDRAMIVERIAQWTRESFGARAAAAVEAVPDAGVPGARRAGA